MLNVFSLWYWLLLLIECYVFQGVVVYLEEQFSPQVHAEFSVLVDVLQSPEMLFPESIQLRSEDGAFMSKWDTQPHQINSNRASYAMNILNKSSGSVKNSHRYNYDILNPWEFLL